MHISKKNALFIYAVLHQFKMTTEMTDSDTSQVTDAMWEISSGLCGEDTAEDDEDSGEDEAFDEDDDDEEEAHCDDRDPPEGKDFRHLSVEKLRDLKPIFVLYEGAKHELEFEEGADEGTVDVLIGQSCVVDEATHILLEDNKLEAFDGESWHAFPLVSTRLPKAWKSLIAESVIYDIE